MQKIQKPTFIIIPAEGDSAETEQWYVKALNNHYSTRKKHRNGVESVGLPDVYILDHSKILLDPKNPIAVRNALRRFRDSLPSSALRNVEIHAQGGYGAYLAYELIASGIIQPDNATIFFVGGAPCRSMTGIAKFFHRVFAPLWYWSRIPFFADDPNPTKDAKIAAIRASSTRTMRQNPKLYRDQLRCLGYWNADNVICFNEYKAWFVPNGEAPKPKWWNNTYNNLRASEVWSFYGVKTTAQPENSFSFYSMMPAEALFKVLDEARQFTED